MAISSAAAPQIYLGGVYGLTSTSMGGYLIASFSSQSTSTTPTWSIVSVSKLSADGIYGICLGETESVIYSVGIQNN